MGHSHHHHHHGPEETGNKIRTAFFLNLGFTIIEVIGGILTNSVAILSDALHDLGDSLSLGLSWYFQKVSKKGRSKSYSYGYKRFSLLGALINSVVLLGGSVLILYESIPRLFEPINPDARGMILLSILGIAVNGLAVVKLKTGKSLNERVVRLHLLEDVLGWVAVLIGGILMSIFDLPILDPILSIGISVYILFNVFKNLKLLVKVIMQGVPENMNEDRIRNYLQDLPEVKQIHDFHIWSMDGEYHVLTVHLVTSSPEHLENLGSKKSEIRTFLQDLGISHSTLEMEVADENCQYEEHC